MIDPSSSTSLTEENNMTKHIITTTTQHNNNHFFDNNNKKYKNQSPNTQTMSFQVEEEDLSSPVDGQVLRLHFACHAELPLGSQLRVTSSESWASSSAAPASTAPPTTQRGGTYGSSDDSDMENNGSLYSSSVEMVTSPEIYPIWRTRHPVIRVVNNVVDNSSSTTITTTNSSDTATTTVSNDVFTHKYRYLVITPGNEQHKEQHQGGGNITSDGKGGVVEVDTWENPFDNHNASDLPYRAVNIDVSSVSSPTFGKVLNNNDNEENVKFTSDGIRIDNWNNPLDGAFLRYKNDYQNQIQQNQQEGTTGYSESDSDAIMNSDLEKNSNSDDVNVDEEKTPKRIFLVCYHLPIILNRNEETGEYTATFSESLIAKTEQSGVSKSYQTQWIGTVSSNFKTEEEKEAIRALLSPMNCTPLFLDSDLRDSFYLGMCKQVLWPAFHNIDLLDISKSGWGKKMIEDQPDSSNWDQSLLDVWWKAYQEVNRTFADTLMTLVQPHDKVWVHDYHLSLLPKMIHEAEDLNDMEQTIQMVYFLHIPFPTSQVFREIEHGGEILEGMLHADVVGFHAFDHARHFLTASKRILGLSHESLSGGLIGVRYRGTKVLVTISNVSIETDVVQSSMVLPSINEGAKALKEKYQGRQIIAGVDIAQGLSGISLKLLAYERLLSDYPNWIGKVVLVQRNLIPSVRIADEIDTLNHVRYLVKRLQTNFGLEVIDYEEIKGSMLPREQRLILWTSSDIFMSTPIREGLNLLPLEYVYVNKQPGVTLISEFSAMSSILNGAIRVNPYDVKLASTLIDKALLMSVEEKQSRRERDITFVSNSPSGQWTRNVLRDLNDVKLAALANENPTKKSLRASAKFESIHNESEINITTLNLRSVTAAYKLAKKRVIFIDFNGTLVMKEPTGKYLKREMLGISGSKPPEETVKALTELCADDSNVVFVVSGDTESNIENAIGSIPGLGLASGNGGRISLPLKSGQSSRTWETIDLGVDWDAVIKIAIPILSKYTARANGAFVKQTASSLGWSYYGCDPEWGEWLATYLLMELDVALHSFDIRVVKLKGVVEVVPRKLSKGNIVKKVLQNNSDAEFILCMGDDVSDEKMFTAVFSALAESETLPQVLQPSHVFTVTVGRKASNASYCMENAEDVAELLIDMTSLRHNLSGRAMSWDRDDSTDSMFA